MKTLKQGIVGSPREAVQALERLRAEGYVVTVQHSRQYDHDPTEDDPDTLLPTGGQTVVTIYDGDPLPHDRYGSVLAQGTSLCRESEAFNRKRGLTIALGRALKYAPLVVRATAAGQP